MKEYKVGLLHRGTKVLSIRETKGQRQKRVGQRSLEIKKKNRDRDKRF